jgi:hypothetical protein
VSLILEALRKLDRDKDAPERGFVVLAHVPWAQGASRSRLAGIGALALAVAVGGLGVALWRGRSARPAVAVAEPPAVASPAPPATSVASPLSRSSPPAPFEAKALAIESLRAAPPVPAPAHAAPPLAAAPARAPAKPAGDLRLNAISRQDDKPVAILNDRLVHEGDVFDDVHVIRIGETEVEVEIRGQRRVLTF